MANLKSMRQALIIFVRNPVPGKVKTRLAGQIGESAAFAAYVDLIGITAKTTKAICNEVDLHIFYSDVIDGAYEWSAIKSTKHIQDRDPDLGVRMKKAFAKLFESGYGKVGIIGSDCPYIGPGLLTFALSKLNSHDLVIGPSYDGGFYFLAVRNAGFLIFDNISWSTESVYRTYMGNLTGIPCGKFMLPIMEDVDEEEAFTRFKKYRKYLNY